MVRRVLKIVAAAFGVVLACAFALAMLLNTVTGVLGVIAAIPVYAMALGVALGGPAAVMFVFFREPPKL